LIEGLIKLIKAIKPDGGASETIEDWRREGMKFFEMTYLQQQELIFEVSNVTGIPADWVTVADIAQYQVQERPF